MRASMTSSAAPKRIPMMTEPTLGAGRAFASASGPSSEVREGTVARLVLIAAALLGTVPSPLVTGWSAGEPHGVALAGFALAWCVVTLAVRAPGTNVRGWMLVLDVAFLTALFAFSGAAENPFTLLYFLPLTLSTLVSQAFTWRVALAAVVGFVVLLIVSQTQAGPHAAHGHFQSHVRGMALSLAVAGLLVAVFAHRLARVLTSQREQIARLVRERERDRLATSLGAVAAGAAHELGSPLGTIQLLVDDLPHMSELERDQAFGAIREQVARMKEVLHGLDSTELSGEVLASSDAWSLASLRDVLAESQPRLAPCVTVEADGVVMQPRAVIEQIARELVTNSERVAPRESIEVVLSASDDSFTLRVLDRGSGFSSDAIEGAIEPFVSHTGGRGLGLFLAHVHARQLGGALVISARPGGGAEVALHLPMRPPSLVRDSGEGGAPP